MQFAISEARKSVNIFEHRVYFSALLVSTLLNRIGPWEMINFLKGLDHITTLQSFKRSRSFSNFHIFSSFSQGPILLLNIDCKEVHLFLFIKIFLVPLRPTLSIAYCIYALILTALILTICPYFDQFWISENSK